MTTKKMWLYVILTFSLFSCKKENDFVGDISQPTQTQVQKPVFNTTIENKQGSDNFVSYNVIPLNSIGGGVYEGVYEGLTLRVNNVTYSTLDLYGQPLPVRNGDPAYADLTVIGGSGGQISQQPHYV